VIEELAKSEFDQYLANKNRGGRNFDKGQRFEKSFAVKVIAGRLNSLLKEGRDALLTAQCENRFVDDLVVEVAKESIECFQLKNSPEVYWGNGSKGSLLFDFYYQAKQLIDVDHSLSLVVSCENRAGLLHESRPAELPERAAIIFFPDKEIVGLLKENHLGSDLQEICKFEDPRLDELSYLAKALLANWCDCKGNCKASDFVQGEVTKFLRGDRYGRGTPPALRVGVCQILDAIPSFKYKVFRGFFSYSYKNTRQVFLFDVYDARFATVQNWIEKEAPREFPGQFEEMLVTWSEF
jgi:hypothetical protein